MGQGHASCAHNQRHLLAGLLGWGPDLVESSMLAAVGIFQLLGSGYCYDGASSYVEIRAPPIRLQVYMHVLGKSVYLRVLTKLKRALGSALSSL